MTTLRLRRLAGLALAACAVAQTVLPPSSGYYEVVDLGKMPGVDDYGGIAFPPGEPHTLLTSAYGSGEIRAVPLVRGGQGRIVGSGPSTVRATVGGNDGGLAFGPGGVLFFTWYGPNRLGQIEPGSSSPDRVLDLGPLGVSGTVGTCAFVPPGRQGAGRFKVASYAGSRVHDLTLVPDGNGTFSIASVSPGVQIQGGPEGMVYPPLGSPLLGQSVLVAEWDTGGVTAYSTDQNGDPMPASRQLVVAGLGATGGGAIDPVSGDFLFTAGNGHLVALRLGATCGAITSYGQATPGAAGTPRLTGVGCARLGEVVTLRVDGPPNGVGVLALGSFPVNVPFQGLTVLTNLEVVIGSGLGGTGVMVAPLYLPATPSLGNRHFYFQAAYLDPTTPSGLTATAGLDLWVR